MEAVLTESPPLAFGSVRARRLLVVDDEPVQRLLVARFGTLCGMHADTAGTLEDAAAMLGKHRFDVVVLDLALQERDGIELLRSIRTSGCDPVMIFISGFDERVRQAVVRLATALGLRVAGALPKPLSLEILRELLGAIPDPPFVVPASARPDIQRRELKTAITDGEIVCVYQPKVLLSDRRITGMEVLTRWRSPSRGMVRPDVFIPLMERHGLIDELTQTVLKHSLTALRGWRMEHPELRLAVNLSPNSLTDLELPERVSSLLDATHIPPEALMLEITESAVMADYVVAADILTRLRIRGVGISIDDFGTGFSSLLSLLQLPFSEIKIDQSFVRLLQQDPEAHKIVRAVIMLARELDVEVVAEGIENEAVAQLLSDLGCQIGQGFLFAPPLDEAALAARLRRTACLPA